MMIIITVVVNAKTESRIKFDMQYFDDIKDMSRITKIISPFIDQFRYNTTNKMTTKNISDESR